MLDREHRGARLAASISTTRLCVLHTGTTSEAGSSTRAADPLGVAAAQAGSLETRRGVVIG